MSQTEAGTTQRTLESYARFLQRTKDMGVVGHRGGLKATRDLLQMCDLQPGQRILEVGCGSGFTACTAAKQSGVLVTGADREPHLLARARDRARSMRVEASIGLTVADARCLPFGDGAFVGVICESVLGFLPDKVEAVREFHRVLTPGGFLANNEVAFVKPPPADFLTALRGAAPAVPGALAVPVDPEEHQRVLEDAGFEAVRAEVGDVSVRQNTLDQLQIDGFRALKPFFASLFDRELRSSVHRKEMSAVQRTFDEHTGYGLFFGRRNG